MNQMSSAGWVACGVILLTLSTLPGFAAQSNTDSAVIMVDFSASPECSNEPTVAWLSQERSLLYQADISPQGTAEFHTRAGRYNLVATGKSGCFAETVFRVGDQEVKRLALRITRSQKPQEGKSK